MDWTLNFLQDALDAHMRDASAARLVVRLGCQVRFACQLATRWRLGSCSMARHVCVRVRVRVRVCVRVCVCACVCVCVCMYIDEILRVRLKSALLERASDDSHVAHIMQPTPQALPIKEHLFPTMQVQTNDAVHPGDSYGNISFFVNAALTHTHSLSLTHTELEG